MSDRDEELLGLLKLNAREPVASLARKLGVSRTTVQDRLKRLETSGVIGGLCREAGEGRQAARHIRFGHAGCGATSTN